jgi:hypothetical protein
MNPEQPESIDVLLQQQAVERTCRSSDQQGSCCNGVSCRPLAESPCQTVRNCIRSGARRSIFPC